MENREGKAKAGGDSGKARRIARPGGKGADERGITPEMRAMAEALAHPDGDPYQNARDMGFYCEQCG